MDLNAYSADIHQLNKKWWQDINTGKPIERNRGELLMLMITEVAEAFTGYLHACMDDKLPERPMLEVELADTAIRIFDYAGGFGLNLRANPKRYPFDLDSIKDLNDLGRKVTEVDEKTIFHDGVRAGISASVMESVLPTIETRLLLVQGQIASAMEAVRKKLGALESSHLAMAIYEISSFAAGDHEFDIEGALRDKLEFNSKRVDHTHEHRRGDGGKKL